MPTVSVIMPSYNHKRYITESIESIINQTYHDWELIIIDDASQDRSQEIIENYTNRDSRIKAIFHGQNRGISYTMNESLEISKGDYIGLTASDDIWLPNKLERQLEVLNQNKNVIVWSDAYIINAEGENTGQLWIQRYKAQQKNKNGNLLFDILRNGFICGQSVLFNREFVSTTRYDPRLIYANDYKFMIDLAENHEFVFIPEPLVKYRVHETNTIKCNKSLWFRDMIIIYDKVLERYDKILPHKLKGKLFHRMSKYFLARKRLRFSRYYLWQAFKQNPFKACYVIHLLQSFFSLICNNISCSETS